jgi:hypothetical protein
MPTPHITRRRASAIVLTLLGAQAGGALAQKGASVALSGVMGSKALLVVNGSAKTLGVGEVHAGVRWTENGCS